MCLSPDLESMPQRSSLGMRRHSDADNHSARDLKLMTSYGDSYTTDAVNILRLGPQRSINNPSKIGITLGSVSPKRPSKDIHLL